MGQDGNGNDRDGVSRDERVERFRDELAKMDALGVPFDQEVERRGRPRKNATPPIADAWSFLNDDVADAEYSAFKVYTRATNKHDHSSKVTVAIPPQLHGMTDELLQAKVVPAYRSVHDFIRDAIYHRLKFWADNSDDPRVAVEFNEELNSYRLTAHVERRTTMIAEYEALMARAADLVQVMARGDKDHLADMLRELEAGAQRMREPYRTRLLEIVERFS